MYIEYAKSVLRAEAGAITSLIEKIDENFKHAVDLILACRERVVVMGIGKVGIVGQKISATLSSTGTPSLFLHPAEAYHGDLGRVVKDDVVLALSNSGETEEIIRLMPYLKEIGAKIVSITADRSSTQGKYSDVVLEIGHIEEACPLGLAPSASTTTTLALGDAIALTVLKNREFDTERYAFYHPGGELGRRLMKVKDIMRTGENNPIIKSGMTVNEALISLTSIKRRTGAANVIDPEGLLVGILTDADIRRLLEKGPDFLSEKVEVIMTGNPKTIGPDKLASEALKILKEHKIDELPVVDDGNQVVGIVDVQDLLSVKIT